MRRRPGIAEQEDELAVMLDRVAEIDGIETEIGEGTGGGRSPVSQSTSPVSWQIFSLVPRRTGAGEAASIRSDFLQHAGVQAAWKRLSS